MDNFDIIVVGAGPGGYVAAIKACQLGMKTAVIERSELGGICLNWGCIPTKALLKSAQIFNYTKHLADYGLVAGEGISITPDIARIVERERGVSATMNKGIEYLFKKNGVTLIKGAAYLKSKDIVEVTGEDGAKTEYQAGHVILATGARANQLSFAPIDGKKIISYREALVPSQLPKSLAVIGSGAIGSELAFFYFSMGVEVHLIEYMDQIVPTEDADVAAQLSRSLRKAGMKVYVSTNVKSVDTTGENCILTIEDKKGEKQIEVEQVLSAVGVVPNTQGLGLEELGVEMMRGRVVVDKNCKSSVDTIYAIGDIIPTQALAHVASAEAILAIESIAGMNPSPIDYSNIPGAIYTTPEIASVGMSEKKVQDAGIAYKVGKFPFTASGKATAAGEKDGFVKLIIDEKTDKILGAHLIGANVTEMIGGIVLARNLGAKASDVMKTIFPHPTMSEGIMEAAEASTGHAIHI